jgi:hypothetical protein
LGFEIGCDPDMICLPLRWDFCCGKDFEFYFHFGLLEDEGCVTVIRIWSVVILTDEAILSETFQMNATETVIELVVAGGRLAYVSGFATCHETARLGT